MNRITNAPRWMLLFGLLAATCVGATRTDADEPRYLKSDLYLADPSAHVFDGKLYIYPSHDIETNIPAGDEGEQFDMRDYHVLSLDSLAGDVTDYGVVLSLDDVPWATRQLWAPDCAAKNGKYYFYFPAKDANNRFRIGGAVGDKPTGPFKPAAQPIEGSYSIDPSVFTDDDGQSYMYFGGIWGGQLQDYRDNQPIGDGEQPADDQPALGPRVARLADSMLEFAEPSREVQIVDASGEPLTAGDHQRRFFEAAWLHKHRGVYYFSYSTGDTHRLCYATGDSPYGPFTYQGVILTPVIGWTTHHSIVEHDGRWYLFHHDSGPSGGVTHLRSLKVVELQHDADGHIETIEGSEQ